MARPSGFDWGNRRPKSSQIVGLGDSSAHWFIASLAVESGIAPNVLLEQSDRMLWTMRRWIIAKNLPR